MNTDGAVVPTWQVRWTAIDRIQLTLSAQATTAPTAIDTGAHAMSPSSASQYASKLRGRILDSASRITTAAPPKRPPRKRPAASTPRKKRSAALALDSVTESADQVGAENAKIARPTKVARHGKGSDGGQPLLPASSTEINSLPIHQPDAGTEKFSAAGPEALRLSVTPPPKHSLVPDAPRKADPRAVGLATNDQFEHSARIETETSARKSLLPESSAPATTLTPEAAKPEKGQSLLASSSAPSSSIDGVDYLLDESFFHELLNPSSPTRTTLSETKLAAVSPPHNTPTKTFAMSFSQNTPTPPSPASKPAPSPASVSTAALTPSPILKAFIRQPPATEPFPSLPQVPSLKAEHRVLTCFRIAEVLRLRSTLSDLASSAGLTIELYARVVASPRHQNEQQIRFADLFFPDRPPYLTATANHALGDASSSLLGNDVLGITTSPTRTASGAKSKVDREAPQESFKLYRAIIQWKQKEGTTTSSAPRHAADAHVLSIWETDWEDVESVRGIVEPQYQRYASGMTTEIPSLLLGDQATKSRDVGHVQMVRSRGTGWRSSTV